MHVHEARISNDDWTAITEKQERKRRQNRLNQRALRQRKRKDEVQIVSGKKPYRVSRWRVEQPKEQLQAKPSSLAVDASVSTFPHPCVDDTVQPTAYPTERSNLDSESELLLALIEKTCLSPRPNYPTPPASVDFPMSSDHLIRLIHQNVFSGLMNNKSLLSKTTYLTKPIAQGPCFIIPPSRDFCDGLTLIHPIIERPLPQSLHPTALQMSIPHSSWLNMFPWPCFRDNLIVNESIVDAGELLYDLFGDLVTYNGPSPGEIVFDISDEDEEDTHAKKRGLIIWSEPWDSEGWEVTQGFLRKWSWLLKGCEELIEVSNRWRAKRNEDPLWWEMVSD